MIRKNTLYDLVLGVWLLLSAGAFIVTYSGQAEPYVSASQLPGGAPHMFGGIVAVWLLGVVVVGRLKTRSWKAAGRAAGLAPEGAGLVGRPELTGSVDGRPVRARTIKRRTSGGGGDEGGSSKTTFTVVEADLSGPAESGFVLGRNAGGAGQGTARFGTKSLRTETFDDGLWAMGAEESFVRDLLDTRTRAALEALGDVDGMLVGDVAGMLTTGAEASTDSRVGGFLAGAVSGAVADALSGDASTVTYETKGLVLDGGWLRRQVEAVAAVADAVEDAPTDRL